ncbi:MAG: hypothetical protein H7Y13_03470 [Sphingobacteriaceae bacterium]|nr:hypothetical protein [Sphingobacteriaceae bacterium]
MLKNFISSLLFFAISLSAYSYSPVDTVKMPNSDTIIVKSFKKSGKLDKEQYLVNNTLLFTRHYLYRSKFYGYHTRFTNASKDQLTAIKEIWNNGTIRISGTLKNGKREGAYRTFYQDGSRQCDCNYKDGKRDGKQMTHYENGQLFYEVIYRNGVPWSILKAFNKDGSPVETFTLKEGNGTFPVFAGKRGRLVKVQHYQLGVVVKTEKYKKSTAGSIQ